MAYKNGEIYGAVSINDVQRAIDGNSADLGRLIRNGNINKWAKYKPVAYAGVGKIRSRDIRAHGLPFTPDPVFDAKTGLNIGIMTGTPSDVAGWTDVEITYERPSGGTAQPFRLTDFSGYNRYAQQPAKFIWKNTFKKDQMMSCTVSIYDRSSAGEDGYIAFSDLISDPSFAQSAEKRLCMAVYDLTVSDTEPSFYFFSEKFTTISSMGTMSVSCTLRNTSFAQWLVEGRTYKFLTMMVTNHSYLEQIPSGDRERWEYGISAAEMSSIETGSNPIKALCLAFEKGEDRCERVLQQAGIITDVSYSLDVLDVAKYGDIVYVSNYAKLCTILDLPTIVVRSLQQFNGSAQYQFRVSFSQGSGSTGIFRPIDKSGNNYYGIQSYTSTTLPETPLTPWVSVNDIGTAGYSTETDAQGRTVHVYEFDFYNRTYIITSNSDVQTLGQSGLFLFFDQQTNFTLTFTLYYRDSNTGTETLIKTLSLQYYISSNGGIIHDINW